MVSDERLVTFPIGATEGRRECINITMIADDDNTEGLECFAVFADGVARFIAVCIEDVKGKNCLYGLTITL